MVKLDLLLTFSKLSMEVLELEEQQVEMEVPHLNA